MHSYLTAGMTFGRLTRLLARNKVSWDPVTVIRLLFLFQSSVWSSIFAAVEHSRYGNRFASSQTPEDPVFIIGHWRTGTTLLFQLMSLDEQFTSPTMFQAAEPDSMLTSHAYYAPVMKFLMKGTRPMDNVKIGMDEPQEDEYAFFRLTGQSPLEQLVFPDNTTYFLQKWTEGAESSESEELLKIQIKPFFAKVLFQKKGILLAKNPFHSFRIRLLLDIFPKARFIRIHRHPFSVVPSTMNLWNIMQRDNTLNRMVHKHTVGEICRGMNCMSESIAAATTGLPPGSYAQLRFEELEKDPVTSLRELYAALGLSFPEDMPVKINEFMAQNHDFKKNRFEISADDKILIKSELNDYMKKYAYL